MKMSSPMASVLSPTPPATASKAILSTGRRTERASSSFLTAGARLNRQLSVKHHLLMIYSTVLFLTLTQARASQT